MNSMLPMLGSLGFQPPTKPNLVQVAQTVTQRFYGDDLESLEAEARVWLEHNRECCGEPIFRIGRGYQQRLSFTSLRAAINIARNWTGDQRGSFVLIISCGYHR